MDEYREHLSLSRKEESLRVELLRIRKTASFRFGNHFVRAIERPWRIFLLPFTIPALLIDIYKSTRKPHSQITYPVRNCIVAFSSSSNRGLHFDRINALLSEFNDPAIQLIHISIDESGVFKELDTVKYYFFPGRTNIPHMNPRIWNQQCEAILNAVLDNYAPSTFIFDGDYPFRGMLNSIKIRNELNRYWIRESSSNYKTSSLPFDGFEHFDAVIHPSFSKNSDPDMNVGTCGTIFCNPILGERVADESRESFRNKYLPPDSQLVFLDVGSLTGQFEPLIDELMDREDVYLLTTPKMKHSKIRHHLRTIEYEGLEYFKAIGYCDAAVLYPDFFSVCSVFRDNIPALCLIESKQFLDSLYTEFDSRNLPLITVETENLDELIHTAVDRLLSTDVQKQLKERMQEITVDYDQEQLVKLIMSFHEVTHKIEEPSL